MTHIWKRAAAALGLLALGFVLGRGSLLLRGAWIRGEDIPAGTLPPVVLEALPAGSGQSSSAARIDLNTADEAALRTLPGIGETLSRRIVAYRTAHGPFASVDELTAVEGIGNALLYRLRDLVTVG